MINSETIGQFISSQNVPGSADVADLEKLLEKYPWSSSLFMLVCSAQNQLKAVNFDELLKKSSIHAADRERLHQLLKKETRISEVVSTGIEVANHKDVTDRVIVADQSDAKVEAQNAGEQLEVKVASTKEEKVSETEPIKSNSLPVETKTHDSEDASSKASAEEDQLEKLVLKHAMDVAFEFSTEDMIPFRPSETKDVLAEPAADAASEVNALPMDESSDEQVTDTSAMSFGEWLNYKKSGKISKQDNRQSIKIASNKEISAKKSGSFFDPVQAARESLIDREDTVTETLAKVHLLQHNFGRAIDAYRHLMMVNPEKKAYFAARIEEIESGLKK